MVRCSLIFGAFVVASSRRIDGTVQEVQLETEEQEQEEVVVEQVEEQIETDSEGRRSFWVGEPNTNSVVKGSDRIRDRGYCQQASEALNAQFGGVQDKGDRPAGCYVDRRTEPGTFYLNTHPTGKVWSNGMPVGMTAFRNEEILTLSPRNDRSLCWNAEGNTLKNGDFLWLWPCTHGGALNDQFQLTAVYNNIVLNANPRKCVGASGGKLKNGDPLILWDCLHDDASQQFVFNEGQKTWHVKQKMDMCIDAQESWGNVGKKSKLRIMPCTGAANQQFHTDYHGRN